jgi:acylphosphatase
MTLLRLVIRGGPHDHRIAFRERIMAIIAEKIVYSGRVQGVGFRVTAQSVARGFPVVGWVRNLPDGNVELWAEGEENQVAGFLKAVRAHWGAQIRSERREPQETRCGLSGFEVRA